MKTTQQLIILIVTILAFSISAVAQNLFDAVDKGDIERITSLITDDPECINQREEKSGLTPLHKAASNGQIDICKLFIEKGADIHATDNSQGTVLHFAAYYGHPEIIKLFIDKGIDANTQDNDGHTPIIWAVFGKKTNTIDELIKHGADLNPPIRIGRSVLHLAAANSNTEVIKYLLNKGIKIDAKSDYGNTPLFWALRAKNYANTKILIENGADLDIRNNDGYTPISFAVSNNETKMVDLLIKNGGNIKKQNSSGDTHLHAAAYEGQKEMVTLLLKKGVNPNIKNDQGITALDLAINRNHQEIQQFLKFAGATQGKGIKKNNSQPAKIGKLSSGIESPVKITIIYDNYVYKEDMEAAWGFSCYIEGTDKNILFDTGTKSDLFIHNLKELDIDHNKVDMVVLSHEHGDHTGGLFPFLEMNHNLSVIMPYSFSYNFVRRVESYGAKALAVKNPFEICNDVYLSGELDARMVKEQSLAINTKKGLVIIVGCSHPGIINIVKNFKETLNKDIYMVFGGSHLLNKTEQEVSEIINQMKELGVQKWGATHCTGELQIQMIKEAFGNDYITIGV
ncbi:MAG: ankyrin repeat domain-containing protein, partial [Candidatus Neomarinimicrobiota bacterium]